MGRNMGGRWHAGMYQGWMSDVWTSLAKQFKGDTNRSYLYHENIGGQHQFVDWDYDANWVGIYIYPYLREAFEKREAFNGIKKALKGFDYKIDQAFHERDGELYIRLTDVHPKNASAKRVAENYFRGNRA